MLHAPLGPPRSGPVADRRLREAAVGRRRARSSTCRTSRSSSKGDFLARRRPGRVRGRAGRGAAQGQVGRVADPAGSREPVGELPQGGHRREDAGPDHEHVGQLRHRVQVGGEDRRRRRSGTRTTATTRSARPARSPTTRTIGGADKDTVTVFSNTQNIASTVTDVQATLGLASPNQVRIIYYEGSSSFGNGYHYLDITDSAALISKLAGAPVRLQLMRWDEQGWTRYGPAIMHDMRGGIDASGNIVAYEAIAFAQASTERPRRRASSPTATSRALRAPAARTPRTWRRCTRSPTTTGQSGLPAHLEDADADDGHVPERHAARAVGPADRRSRRSSSSTCSPSRRRAWIRTRSGSRTSARTARPGRAASGRATRACSTAAVEAARRGYKPHVSASQLQSGNVVTRLGHGDRDAQRLVRRDRRLRAR